MKRKPNWRTLLAAYVEQVAHKPFAWGEHDCALFAAGAVEAMTGEDIAAGYRGRYKTLAGGRRMLKRKGFDTHADLAASLFEVVHPSSAQVGDLAAIEVEGGMALGVVQGERIYVIGPDESRIGTVALSQAARAFRVPFIERKSDD